MSSPPALSQFFLILLFFTQVMSISSNKNAALLQQVCKKTHDYNLCVSSLKPDPRSLQASDSKDLAVIMMDVALIKALGISELIVELNRTTSDPIMKSRFDACSSDYIVSIGYLQQAINACESSFYKDSYGMLIVAASSGPGQCEADFAKPPARKSPLTAPNVNLGSMITIAEDILSTLLI